MNSQAAVHHEPTGFSDRFARCVIKLLRWMADMIFAKRYGHRAVVLETVAADATLRDVVLVVREDEAHHRDVNHAFAGQLSGQAGQAVHVAPYTKHVEQAEHES